MIKMNFWLFCVKMNKLQKYGGFFLSVKKNLSKLFLICNILSISEKIIFLIIRKFFLLIQLAEVKISCILPVWFFTTLNESQVGISPKSNTSLFLHRYKHENTKVIVEEWLRGRLIELSYSRVGQIKCERYLSRYFLLLM